MLGAILLGGCGEKKMTPEEAQQICPAFNSHVKACQADFDKAWGAAEGTDTFSADTSCRGTTVGYGMNHPDWYEKLKACTLDQKADCATFAKCAVELVKYKGH
jgi:hypothetical protein